MTTYIQTKIITDIGVFILEDKSRVDTLAIIEQAKASADKILKIELLGKHGTYKDHWVVSDTTTYINIDNIKILALEENLFTEVEDENGKSESVTEQLEQLVKENV